MFKTLSGPTQAGIFSALVLVLALIFASLNSPITLALYMLIPALTAALMLFVVTRDGYTKAGLAQLGLHHLGWRQWLAAVLIPLVVILISYNAVWVIDPASYVGFNGGIKWFNTTIFFLGLVVFQTLTASLGEELGWRGYLLPKLLPLGKLKAYLWVGLLWAVWHYPLIFIVGSYNAEGNKLLTTLLFTLTLIPLSIITGELRLRSNSVWPASIFHSSHNTIWQLLVSISLSTPLMIYAGGEVGLIPLVLYGLVAIFLLRQKA